MDIVERVVIGSKSISDPQLVNSWIDRFSPESIILALDVRLDINDTPMVSTHGWKKNTDISLWDAIESYNKNKIKYILCTDISKDGALAGPNLNLYKKCVEYWPSIKFQASGGIRDEKDIKSLIDTGVYQAISGKALLEGNINKKEIIKYLLKE